MAVEPVGNMKTITVYPVGNMKRVVFLLAFVLCCISGDAKTYPERIKALITRMEARSDVDPDSFAVDVKALEHELEGLDRPDGELSMGAAATLKSIVHGVLATAYHEMKNSHISDFDAETQERYTQLAQEHFGLVLEGMNVLAGERSKDYIPLIRQGKGSKYYGHNMLAVMLDFVESHWDIYGQQRSGKRSREGLDSLYARARRIYQARGDRNSDAMLRLRELENTEHHTPAGRQLFCRRLEALRDSTHDIEAGKLVANRLEEEVNGIMSTSVNLHIAENILADMPFGIRIEARNATRVTLQLLQYNGKNKHGQPRLNGRRLMGRKYELSTPKAIAEGRRAYLAVNDSLQDSLTLEAGRYVLLATAAGDTAISEICVTTLHHALFYTPDNKVHAFTLDRKTGLPRSDVQVLLYRNHTDDTYDTLRSDKQGEVVFGSKTYRQMRATKDVSALDTYREDATEMSYIYHYDYPYTEKLAVHGNLFTDRGIYRPGQTIHASALLYAMLGDETHVVKEGCYLFILRTPDGKETVSDTLSPGGMGTLTFDFILPAACKLGTCHLSLKDARQRRSYTVVASQSVQVEEYKRPTYSVAFQKDTTTYTAKDSITALLKAETFAGITVAEAKVSYTLEVAKQRFFYWGNSRWQTVESKDTQTNGQGQASIAFRPSVYGLVKEYMENAYEGEKLLVRIKANVTDNAGESHQTSIHYVIPLKPKKKAEAEKPDPLKLSRKEAYPGESIDIDYTPEDKEAYVFYYMVAGEKVIDQAQQLVGETLHKRIVCQKEWGDGATVTVFYVKNGRVHREQKTITVPKPDKKLNLTWHTFRDHLTPGQQETWTLTVKDKQEKGVDGAEVLASMYDASLDELSSFGWRFSIPFVTRISNLHCIHSHPTYTQTLNMYHQAPFRSLMPTEFDMLEGYQGMGRYGRGLLYGMKSSGGLAARATKRSVQQYDAVAEAPVLMASAAPESMATNRAAKVTADSAAEAAETEEEGSSDAGEIGGQVVSLRSNFNETAFFCPNLRTDADGNVQIAFTLPESLTEWKFLGFAHTEDVRYGLMTASAVASKDFMVQPQLPRFLRTADQATIQARIFNKSEVNIEGTATMRLLLAKDERTVVYKQNKKFVAEQGGSAIVTFNIPEGTLSEDVVCEITATDGSCSDGERNLLLVLSTQEVVTENIPFYLEGASTKDIDLTSLYNGNSPTATHRTLSVGYTDNPAIDVFQSLRSLQLPSHDNAPCYAAAIYSNLVMLSLYDRLSVLGDSVIKDFDTTEAQRRADDAQKKLKELQLADGSWSWFKGMEGSPYITLAVAEHLDKLQNYMHRLGLPLPNDIERMQEKALRFLNKHEVETFTRRKAQKETLQPTDFDLRYMAICPAGGKALVQTGTHSLMLVTYLDELAKNLNTLTIYGRAKGACILQRFQRKAQAKKFVESVKHYLVYKPGLGRYFATDRAYYSWQDYRIPTQLAAMRCLSKDLADKSESALLHDMQLWLLRQKQTQLWGNPLNAIDVADYLITLSPDETVRKAETPRMKLDKKTIVLKTEGNRSISETQELKNSSVATLSVEKHSPGISWGYVRGTFLEEAEKLNTYTTGELSVERKLYLKQGEEWVELGNGLDTDNSSFLIPHSSLTIGSILRVRHIIHADRDMDFVSVTSRHAACMEPRQTRSGYQWMGTRGCYLELHDTETSIFFNHFRRGTTTIDLDYYITRTGQYQSGVVQTQCEYAPEFGGYSTIYKLKIEP